MVEADEAVRPAEAVPPAPAAPPLPARPAWAASAVQAALPDSALAAAYLRRLGYSEEEASNLVSSDPFKGTGMAPKTLLSSLVQRHVLRIPFENLEYIQAAPSARAEACLQRLRSARLTAERIALGFGGGLAFDLNLAFAWLLRQLGAKVRLASAWAFKGTGYAPAPTHILVLVDLPEGALLADPGFSDPPRAAIRSEGSVADDMAIYEVVSPDEADCPAAAYTKVLRRTRGNHSLSRHVENPEAAALDQVEAAATPVYAFRPGDNLALDAEEIQEACRLTLAPGGELVERRLLCLGLPKGHIVLSEGRSRRTEGGHVAEEVAVDGPETWQKLASAILGRPLLSSDLKVGRPVPLPRAEGERRSSSGVESLARAFESQSAATSKSKNWGIVGSSSIAVGGAGAGGGMGLNAPGFGPKVQNFSGSRGSVKSLSVDDEIPKAWARVMDEKDPLGWIFCSYTPDGKTLELSNSGEGGLKPFKEQLGAALGWGGFRACAIDKRGGVECKRQKFIFVQYKPESAPAIKKAKQGSHKGEVKDAIHGAHLDVIVENAGQDLDEQTLIEKMQAATGAHKPNGYEFEEGVFLEADFYGLGIGRDCKGETSKN